jgi:O-antigen/teichoic acid export membrane protein
VTEEDAGVAPVVRGGSVILAIRIAGSALAYLSIVQLARWMGGAQYGAFAFASSWLQLLVMPAGLGLHVAAVRFLPAYEASGNTGLIRGFLSRSIMITFGSGCVLSVLALLVVILAGDRIDVDYRLPLLIAFIGIPLSALLTLGSQIGRAFGWVTSAYAPSQVIHPVLLLSAVFIALRGGTQPFASVVLSISIALVAVIVVIQGILYYRRIWPRIRAVDSIFDNKTWLNTAISLLLMDAFVALTLYTDIVMVGFYLPPSSAGYYHAAVRTATLVTFFITAIGGLAGPRIAHLFAQGKVAEIQALIRGVTPWIMIPATIAAVIIIAAGHQLLRFFGAGFDSAYLPMVILVSGYFIASALGPAALLLNMTQHQTTSARIYGIAAVGNVALNAILIPVLSLTGAAIATALTTSCAAYALATAAHRKLAVNTAFFLARRQLIANR